MGSLHHFPEFCFHLVARPGVPLAGQGDDSWGRVLHRGRRLPESAKVERRIGRAYGRAMASPTSRFKMSVAVTGTPDDETDVVTIRGNSFYEARTSASCSTKHLHKREKLHKIIYGWGQGQ